MVQKKSIAVILSGCGRLDGSEIHEATLTLWATHKNGADYQCYAPNIPQHQVYNHLNGELVEEQRNVLVESARIARGDIRNLAEYDAEHHDALILPGGMGAAKNLSSFASDGAACLIHDDVLKAIHGMTALQKPIGALCIAPVILARILPQVQLTVGQDPTTIAAINTMGASHISTMQTELVVDTVNRVVSTPCYMLDARVDQIGESVDQVVQKILELMEN